MWHRIATPAARRLLPAGGVTRRSRRPYPLPAALLGALIAVGACGSAATTAPGATTAATPVKLTVGLGYIPSVQFAPFYLAQQSGYYRAAGLDVTFQNRIDPDLIPLVGQGSIDIGIGDGTSVIPAVAQGIPIRYVATIYAKFPSIVFAKAASGIRTAADLKGRRIGTPGRYGSGWIMLEALLGSAGLTPSDVDVQLYPDFGQEAALAQGAIDAATGFVNNEPVQLELAGTPATILRVDQIVPLPGNGLIAGVATLQSKHEALRAFVTATLRAMRDVTADPGKGLAASVAAVPDLGKDPATQTAILKATIDTWSNDYTAVHGLGAIDRNAWQSTLTFLGKLPGAALPSTPPVDSLIDASLLGG